MRFWGILLTFLLLFVPLVDTVAQEEQQPAETLETQGATSEEEVETERPPEATEETPPEELAEPEVPEEVEELREELEELSAEELVKEGEGPKRITIDSVVVVKYAFLRSSDRYTVKYHLNMGGEVQGEVGMIKGDAKVATDISGFLFNNNLCQCLLKVSISDVPYEIVFKRTTETEADVTVLFKGQILEDWESMCTFLDASGAKFNTRGAPERWIATALEKTKPSLSRLTAPLDPKKVTSVKFSIPKYTVEDEGLGSAEIDGTGIVTIQSTRKNVQKKTPSKNPSAE